VPLVLRSNCLFLVFGTCLRSSFKTYIYIYNYKTTTTTTTTIKNYVNTDSLSGLYLTHHAKTELERSPSGMREPTEQLQTVLVVYTDKRPHTPKNSHAPQPRNQTKLERSGGDASARSMYGARVAGRARTVPATPARGSLDRPAYTANENDTAATHPEKLLCTPHEHAEMELQQSGGGANARSTHRIKAPGRARAVPASPREPA